MWWHVAQPWAFLRLEATVLLPKLPQGSWPLPERRLSFGTSLPSALGLLP